MYLFYVDDSTGSGHEMLTAVGVDARRWSVALDRWLEFRRLLSTDWGLPKPYELHAGKFISGRGWPNQADPAAAINHDQELRQTIYQQALDAIVAAPDLDIHTVHRSARHPNSRRVYWGLLTFSKSGSRLMMSSGLSLWTARTGCTQGFTGIYR